MIDDAVLLAHGIGERADLPLPLSLVAYSAGAVLVLSFAALAWLWPRPRWEVPDGSHGIGSKVLPPWLQTSLRLGAWPLRAATVGLLAVATYAAFTGPDAPLLNVAPTFVYVAWWVGFLFASGAIGDVFRAIGPIWAIARAFPKQPRTYTFGYWPAAIGLLAFTWLELVHPNAASPRVLGVALAIYLATTLIGLTIWGRVWLRDADMFGALFGLVGAMAPLHADEDGKLRVRPPLVGLSALRPKRGIVALITVALGSTTFDGLARTTLWTSLVGDSSMLIDSLGLVWTIGAVYALYRLAVSSMPILSGVPSDERDADETAEAFVHSLVPITLAYAIAHYFSLLVFEGQTFIALLSDPLGRGWDLFGTASFDISYSPLSPNTIAYVQVGAIVLGHVAGVILAHDRAVSRYPGKVATRTQYPMLAAMVIYTVGALLILLGG